MKRILHVLSTNRISGAENVAADICMMFKGEYDMIATQMVSIEIYLRIEM